MIIDVSRKLYQLSGKPLVDQAEDGTAVDAVVRTALVNIALSPDSKDDGVKKVKKYELAKKIYMAKDVVDLAVEELAMLRKGVEANYPPLICGQLVDILEGKE